MTGRKHQQKSVPQQQQEQPTEMSEGNTSFLRAARAGHLDKVLEHLKQNIDINTSNANGLNALHLASKDGHAEVVEELLKRGAAVDAATKKGNTALHIASLAGQEEVVRLLVQHGASVNVQSQNGFTPLYMAAQENHDNVVKYLLANGANQSLATEDGFTPLAVAMQQGHDKVVTVLLENDTRGKVRLPALHIAAKKDDVKAAKLLLENEHNPDVTSKSGFTPLHIAAHYGNESIANLLIQKGADVNYAAKHNISPLHVAAKWGKANMVAVLLDRGANIESKTRDGLTPIHCAARSGHEQVVDMLLERSAPISSKTKNGLAPLHMAAQGDHVDAARILLYHRAPVDEVTVDYLTALHVAAHCGHARVAKLLLDRGADANARALNGFTPLHIACKKNRIKVVELLLKHGASIGATTESGLTPLHVASFMGCMNIVIYLLQHDANPDVPTVRGETPLHLAARANQTDIIRILLRNGASVDARAREQQTPLHIASRLGNVDIVMLLLQHGAKVDTTTKDMYTALHIAAKEGQDEVATALIDNGASLNATTKKGFTPLHLASKYGNLKVAKLLLQKEAPVDAQGKNDVTPLHVAAHYDHQNVALLLLDKGASPHATAKNGHTPLHIAAKKNQMDIANTLLEYGANSNAESKAGFAPLHLSAQEGHVDMSSLLLEHNADPNRPAKNGLAPLHLCAQEDRVPVAEVLVKNGANVDAQTKAGYTPLHIASHYGQTGMVRYLLGKGADVKSSTSLGYSPLHQAAQQGHTNVVNILLENSAQPNAVTVNGQTPLNIAQKLGYITVVESLKVVTEPTSKTTSPVPPPHGGSGGEEKYRVVAPEAMHETFLSDSEEEGGEDTLLGDHTTYRYLTADEMKSLGDDSMPIDVTKDERMDSNRMVASADSNILAQQNQLQESAGFESPHHITQNYSEYVRKYTPDNVDVARHHPVNIGFLVSFLVDARGGAMRGCRHSGVRVIVPPRCAPSPTRITCRYVRPQRTPHPPPLMEGEALASRVLELGPVGVKFLGPVIIEVPHFAALRGKEREIVILRSDNGETWREHTVDQSEDILSDVLHDSFEADDLSQMEDPASGRITRIVTSDFPQYFAVVSRVRQEVHAIGPEGGMVSSTVVPQVQAVFPQGALTKKIKVGLQAQLIDPELTAKLLGHGVAVSPVVTVEPRRRKFHKAITLSMPAPRAHSQGMINQYSGSAPTLRLLCSITGGTTRAQWEDVTGSTPLTFVNDCVSFTTTVSARFWLMDCRNIGDATKMATELYKEAIHVPFMAKFVVFAKRVDPLEARLRVFCMTDDKEDKTLEHQEHFTEVAKSRDVEVLEGKPQYVEFAGNLVPVTKSGEQLQFSFRAFRENRLPFSVRVKDQHAESVGRCLFMREPKVQKGEPPQQPICILNIVLPDDIVSETISLTDSESWKRSGLLFLKDGYEYYRPDPRLADMSNLLGEDWVALANQLGLTSSEINVIKSEYPDSVAKQAQSMLRMWISQSGNRAQTNVLETALTRIGREDIIPQCLNVEPDEHHVTKITKTTTTKEYYTDKDRFIDADDYKPHIDKYSAEEKIVEDTTTATSEEDDEENFKKTVSERRNLIEKRLSAERTIPASTQRVEIVQEISTIKRQSMVEDKIAEVEEKTKVTETTEQTTAKPQETVRSSRVSPAKEEVPLVTKERRDSDLLMEGVSQKLVETAARERTTPRITTEDPNSPKLSKTPPPSPADFLIRERATTNQEWSTSGRPAEDTTVASRTYTPVTPPTTTSPITDQQQQQQDTGLGLTQNLPELTPSVDVLQLTDLPKPKPRVAKGGEQQPSADSELLRSTQRSPVRDDILDAEDELRQDEDVKTYSDKKKFWESLSVESSSSLTAAAPPVPKPRTVVQQQSSESADESSTAPKSTIVKQPTEEITPASPKIMSEYQAQFMDPSVKQVQQQTDSKENLESEKGYISDSEDVEHYISDSEIEDRVPQIRTRQMSVFHPSAPARKTLYERSFSLPTEDLYDISASMMKLRKQYFEEQIRKELVEEQLATESEDEASPERKTLTKKQSSPKVVKFLERDESIDGRHNIVREYAEIFLAEQEEFARTSPLPPETHKMSSTESDRSLSDLLASSSRPSDSLEVHIDKSEVEGSEKDDVTNTTDIETKSLDSLNAATGITCEDIPEITVTLSGKQRRISEDSEGSSFEEIPPQPIVVVGKSATSPIPEVCHPEEDIVESTVWETPVQLETTFEKATTLETSESLSEVQQRSSDHSEIEQIILESLQCQNISHEEAKRIAAELVGDIEHEIQKRNVSGQELTQSLPETTKSQVSEYLRHLAETKGLDSREVELVESVLARKQRQFAKLKRDDTQASSMEITDEDLRYSGTDVDLSPSGSQAHILEQLEAEKTAAGLDIEGVFETLKKEYDDKSSTSAKSEDRSTSEFAFCRDEEKLHEKEKVDVEGRTLKETKSERFEKSQISEEREGIVTSSLAERDIASSREETALLRKDVHVSDTKASSKDSSSLILDQSDRLSEKKSKTSESDTAQTTQIESSIRDTSHISGTLDSREKISEICDDKTIDSLITEKKLTDNVIEVDTRSKHEDLQEVLEQSDGSRVEVSTTKQHTSTKTSSSSMVVEETHKVVTSSKDTSSLDGTFVKRQEVSRTLSDDSKSSQDESAKSPEDQFSTCSSGRKGDSDTPSKGGTPKQHEVVLRTKTATTKTAGSHDTSSSGSGTGVLKPDRRSGVDFEAYSSSGESHYHSFEIDSGSRSRPCSSDVEGMVAAAGSSEYESALTSQEVSARSSHYQTAASSLSSKEESMKSLDSESSGNLASVEVSELSETLVASDDLDYQAGDEEGPPMSDGGPTRQSTQVSDSELAEVSEEEDFEQLDRNATSSPDDVPSRMKRSQEMTFQPEPKVLSAQPDSPSETQFAGSLDDGSILSVSLSSTSSIAAQRTVVEMNASVSSEQFSMEEHGSLTMADSFTSTPFEQAQPVTSVTIISATVEENGVQNASTQVTQESKKKGHRRTESTSFAISGPTKIPKTKMVSELAESYETEADQGFRRDMRESDDQQALLSDTESDQSKRQHAFESHSGKVSASSSEKSSFEEAAEAEAAFSMVAHVSPAHKQIKQICPIMEDDDAEKSELEARERARKELEERRARKARDHSPGSIPDITVTQHMTPLRDRGFKYPDLDLERHEEELLSKSTPETPASTNSSSKTSEDTDQGKEYVLEDASVSAATQEELPTESKSTVIEKTESPTESPDSDSFEMLEKPDLMDDFVIIEEVAKEALEHDSEGKSVKITTRKRVPKKHDEELEDFLIKSSGPATKLTDVKYYPDGSSSDELGFEFEDSPPVATSSSQKSTGVSTAKDSSSSSSSDYLAEYDKELEANKKWMEQQFHGDQAIMVAAGYAGAGAYEVMEFERIPLEDIKEEEIADLDAISSRIGSMNSQKESLGGGSLGSAKDSFSSTPDYDVLAGRRYFTKSGEHDDVSMSSLQEFENLERAMSLENRRYHQGSQDSSSNGSFGKRYTTSKGGQGDDISVSSLKEFEGLEKACIAVHNLEQKVQEEEALLTQIEEGHESLPASESESTDKIVRVVAKRKDDEDDEEDDDYEKRMFEIDEIIRQAQSNVEKFIELRDDEKPESIGRGDSLEEVSKIPDLDLDMPLKKTGGTTGGTKVVQWGTDDDMTSTDSLELKESEDRRDSADSLDPKVPTGDVMTASTDSIEFQNQLKRQGVGAVQSDSIEFTKELQQGGMVSSDSLELASATGANVAALLSDSIDEDGSRIGVYDHSSSSTGKDFSSSVREDLGEPGRPEGLDPLDLSSSTATHATCHYETDSVFSGSFTSGGSNTMVSSTDTIDPYAIRETVDLAAAVRKVWFEDEDDEEDVDEGAAAFTTDYTDPSSRPYVTEVIEPCEDPDEPYSHTIHRRVELPPEIRKVTFTGPDADRQMRAYMDRFGEGDYVQETEEVDADGNVHVRRVIQKKRIVSASGKDLVEGQGVVRRTTTSTSTSQQQRPGEDSSSTGGEIVGETWSKEQQQQHQQPQQQQPPVASPRHQLPFRDGSDDQRQDASSHRSGAAVTDQHQLSEDMKRLLEDMERESKK